MTNAMVIFDSEQLAQVHREHMLLIIHCWHYIRRPWYMMILIFLDPHSCFDLDDSFDDGHIQVVDLDVADRCLWCRSYMLYDSFYDYDGLI